MAKVNISNVEVLDTEATFLSPFRFKITFECYEPLEEDLEWRLIYVSSAYNMSLDQTLDSILVGPVPVGKHQFVFEAGPPNTDVIPVEDAVGVTVVIVACLYRDQEFIRVGYYVNNEYSDEQLRETPPDRPQYDKLARQILAGNPRITRRGIDWGESVAGATADSAFEAAVAGCQAVAGAAEAADSGSGSVQKQQSADAEPQQQQSAESQQRHQQVSESSNKKSDTMDGANPTSAANPAAAAVAPASLSSGAGVEKGHIRFFIECRFWSGMAAIPNMLSTSPSRLLVHLLREHRCLLVRCCAAITASPTSGHPPPVVRVEASDAATEQDIRSHLSLFPQFISESEEAALMSELQPILRKLRYESAHWDDAIHNYRETERTVWSDANRALLQRVAETAGLTGKSQLEHVHVLDLAEDGHIRPHVDAVRFCGSIIAGLSLLSDCVMRFTLATAEQSAWAKVLLPRRSLYVMKDRLRYDYAHAVLGNDDANNCIGKQVVRKGRRVSVICRCQPDPERVKAADGGQDGSS
uniref:2OG-FeII_Oxy_2 domain-containing protein n=1 Tax=Macrostomum lignano TaxID=282301 RepID=A0A1I8GSR6_9PLAT